MDAPLVVHKSIDEQITDLEKCMERRSLFAKGDKREGVAEKITALMFDLSQPDVTSDVKLRAWSLLKKVDKWNTTWRLPWDTLVLPGTAEGNLRGVVNYNLSLLQEQLKKPENLGKIYAEVVPKTAADKKLKEAMKLFYDKVTIPNCQRHNRAALVNAINNQDLESVQLLMLEGRLSRSDLKIAMTEAMLAVLEPVEDYKTGRRLAEIDERGIGGEPDLAAANKERWEEGWKIIEALVDAGAPVDRRVWRSTDEPTLSLVQLATAAGQPAFVHKLLRKGVPWDKPTRAPAKGVLIETGQKLVPWNRVFKAKTIASEPGLLAQDNKQHEEMYRSCLLVILQAEDPDNYLFNKDDLPTTEQLERALKIKRGLSSEVSISIEETLKKDYVFMKELFPDPVHEMLG